MLKRLGRIWLGRCRMAQHGQVVVAACELSMSPWKQAVFTAKGPESGPIATLYSPDLVYRPGIASE